MLHVHGLLYVCWVFSHHLWEQKQARLFFADHTSLVVGYHYCSLRRILYFTCSFLHQLVGYTSPVLVFFCVTDDKKLQPAPPSTTSNIFPPPQESTGRNPRPVSLTYTPEYTVLTYIGVYTYVHTAFVEDIVRQWCYGTPPQTTAVRNQSFRTRRNTHTHGLDI